MVRGILLFMKERIPLIILTLIIIAGALWLFVKPLPILAPADKAPVATTTDIAQKGADEPVVAAPAPGVPSGLQVTKQTIWLPYMNSAWELGFRYQSEWEVSEGVPDENGEITQVSISTPEATMLLTKEVPIIEPARLEANIYTRTIADQEVEVRKYTKPNDTYAYYLYFTIVLGNDDYHVSIKSYNADTKPVDDFISRIVIK